MKGCANLIDIQNRIIKEESEKVIYNLNYPYIKKSDANYDVIDEINNIIYEDIVSFKEVINLQTDEKLIDTIDYKKNIITEYKEHLNENQILSLSIEFSQLLGLYGISYIYSYNYNLDEKREITLKDLFKKDVNYTEIIKKEIESIMKERIRKYAYQEGKSKININIYEDQTFYIEKDKIVISFSSYELDNYILSVVEFEIPFSKLKEYLSEYTFNNIYKEN